MIRGDADLGRWRGAERAEGAGADAVADAPAATWGLAERGALLRRHRERVGVLGEPLPHAVGDGVVGAKLAAAEPGEYVVESALLIVSGGGVVPEDDDVALAVTTERSELALPGEGLESLAVPLRA